MPTFEDYRARPREATLGRLARTPADLKALIGSGDETLLGRRPAPESWSAREILCHLRDVEELFQIRFHTILAVDEPTILVVGASPEAFVRWRFPGRHPIDPDRWAAERQYARQDTREALGAFERRRAEVLAVLHALSDDDWKRAGVHLGRGRLTLAEWAASLAGHDDNHLAQLERAVAGRA